MVIAINNFYDVNELKILLRKKFDIKNLDIAKILGMDIHKNISSRKLWLSKRAIFKRTPLAKAPYSRIVGCLVYFMVSTRLDFIHAISQVYKFMSKLDFNYVGGLNDRRSTTNYEFTFSKKSTIQIIEAMFTTKAKYMKIVKNDKEAL
ncbi:hypothetical protein CR513_52612, partial [Mucuna pruriens]